MNRADFQISSLLKHEDVETRCDWETHLNFPGKDVHRVHFNPQGTPRRNMTERQSERASTRRGEEKRYGCTYADGGLKAERPVSRARPKREQLIAMCGGRRGILIFPLNAMPTNGSAFWLQRGLRKRRRGVESLHDRHRSYPEFFFYELPAVETTLTLDLKLPA